MAEQRKGLYMKWHCYGPEDFVRTNWGGGVTEQMAIYPEHTSCKNQDFMWRVSSASVEQEESDFTVYSEYNRIIGPLDGCLELHCKKRVVLFPGDIYEFDGKEKIHSLGICKDINVMLRKESAEGTMQILELTAGTTIQISSALLPTESYPETFMGIYCSNGVCRVGGRRKRGVEVLEGGFLLLIETGMECLTICAEEIQTKLYVISIRNRAKQGE